jgi:hypothetical protein
MSATPACAVPSGAAVDPGQSPCFFRYQISDPSTLLIDSQTGANYTTAGIVSTAPATLGALTAPSITFGTGQSALNEYIQNGTWTPTIEFGGASTGITYSVQTGEYTRIGNLVHIEGSVQLSSNGTATGSATIAGLPFSNGGPAYANLQVTRVANMIGITNYRMQLSVVTNLITINTDPTTTTPVTNANFAANTLLTFSGTYRVS